MTSLTGQGQPPLLELHGQVSYVDTIDEVFVYIAISTATSLFNCSNEKFFFLEGIADSLYNTS